MKKFQQEAKDSVGKAAADLVREGTVIGLGSGSTAERFIYHLVQRCLNGLSIKAVSSSIRSMELAKQGGIPVLEIDQVSHIDMTVDGADEIDPAKRLIKGGGGALLREKIVASNSSEMVVIIDSSKKVDRLGTTMPLPVEVLPFGHLLTQERMKEEGMQPELRMIGDRPYATDNHNYIYDLHFEHGINNPEEVDRQLKRIPGVIETGLFFNLAKRVLIGNEDDSVEILK